MAKKRKNRNYTIGRLAGVPSFNMRGKFVTSELGLEEGDKVALRHDLDVNKLVELYQKGELLILHKMPKLDVLRQANEKRMAYLKREMLVCEERATYLAT